MTDKFYSFEREAEALFREFASKHSLQIQKEDQDEIELMMSVPAQPGLSFDLFLWLQNGDEITIGFEEFWSNFFPFSTSRGLVEKLLDGLMTRETRLVTKNQMSWTIGRDLEYLEDHDWKIGYRQICGLRMPFIKTHISYFYNDPGPDF